MLFVALGFCSPLFDSQLMDAERNTVNFGDNADTF